MGIVEGFIGEEQPDGCQHIGGHPHPPDGGEYVLFHESFTEVVEHEEDHEEDHGEDQGQADAALADDGAEGRADQEHDQHRDGERDLLVPGDLVLAEVVLLGIEEQHGLVEADLGAVDGGDGVVHDGDAGRIGDDVG